MLPPVFGVLFDGIAYGMLLFLLSVGLSVTLGLMNFVNLAHCAFAMLGGYVTVTLMTRFPLAVFRHSAVPSSPPRSSASASSARSTAGSTAPAISTRCCSPSASPSFRSRSRPMFFGTTQQPIDVPAYLRGSFKCWGSTSPSTGCFWSASRVITLLLVGALEYTRFGAQVRASVDNQRMASGLGIDVDRTFAVTFALGCGLAGLGGALAIEIVGLDPNFSPSPTWFTC